MNEITDFVNTALNSLFRGDPYVPEWLSIMARTAGTASSQIPYKMQSVDITDEVFWQAAIIILLHPLLWNIIARVEYYTHIIRTICRKPEIGVYLLALWIVVVGCYRDALFVAAVRRQKIMPELATLPFQATGLLCLFGGLTLVLSSFYQLGVCGTYLGDYFGILKEERVTAFPFNVCSDPMYDGATLAFLGKSIM